jgi:hypothetical protein
MKLLYISGLYLGTRCTVLFDRECAWIHDACFYNTLLYTTVFITFYFLLGTFIIVGCVILSDVTSCFLISPHVISSHLIPCPLTSCHVMSCIVTIYHAIIDIEVVSKIMGEIDDDSSGNINENEFVAYFLRRRMADLGKRLHEVVSISMLTNHYIKQSLYLLITQSRTNAITLITILAIL